MLCSCDLNSAPRCLVCATIEKKNIHEPEPVTMRRQITSAGRKANKTVINKHVTHRKYVITCCQLWFTNTV